MKRRIHCTAPTAPTSWRRHATRPIECLSSGLLSRPLARSLSCSLVVWLVGSLARSRPSERGRATWEHRRAPPTKSAWPLKRLFHIAREPMSIARACCQHDHKSIDIEFGPPLPAPLCSPPTRAPPPPSSSSSFVCASLPERASEREARADRPASLSARPHRGHALGRPSARLTPEGRRALARLLGRRRCQNQCIIARRASLSVRRLRFGCSQVELARARARSINAQLAAAARLAVGAKEEAQTHEIMTNNLTARAGHLRAANSFGRMFVFPLRLNEFHKQGELDNAAAAMQHA